MDVQDTVGKCQSTSHPVVELVPWGDVMKRRRCTHHCESCDQNTALDSIQGVRVFGEV